MFSNLRTNSQIYILHKDSSPYVEVGSVVSVSQPLPKFPVPNFMQPQEMVVDITVRVNESTITLQKLPANLDVADLGINGNMVITTSREAMNSEINSLRQKSINVLNSVEYHLKLVQDCELLLLRLNPEFAEQRQLKQEIDLLKLLMSEVIESMKLMMSLMKETTKD